MAEKGIEPFIIIFTITDTTAIVIYISPYFFFLLLFKHSCLHFTPMTLPHPTHPHLPPSVLSLFGFVHGSFIHVPWQPFPFFL